MISAVNQVFDESRRQGHPGDHDRGSARASFQKFSTILPEGIFSPTPTVPPPTYTAAVSQSVSTRRSKYIDILCGSTSPWCCLSRSLCVHIVAIDCSGMDPGPGWIFRPAHHYHPRRHLLSGSNSTQWKVLHLSVANGGHLLHYNCGQVQRNGRRCSWSALAWWHHWTGTVWWDDMWRATAYVCSTHAHALKAVPAPYTHLTLCDPATSTGHSLQCGIGLWAMGS